VRIIAAHIQSSNYQHCCVSVFLVRKFIYSPTLCSVTHQSTSCLSSSRNCENMSTTCHAWQKVSAVSPTTTRTGFTCKSQFDTSTERKLNLATNSKDLYLRRILEYSWSAKYQRTCRWPKRWRKTVAECRSNDQQPHQAKDGQATITLSANQQLIRDWEAGHYFADSERSLCYWKAAFPS